MPHVFTLMEAARFAAIKHNGQMRSGTDLPYIVHPLEVATIAAEYTTSNQGTIVCAALLHDVIEDTDATYEEIAEEFGQRVADVVLEVTDDPNLTKKEQREYLFAHAHEKSREARIVKIADGISNVSSTNDKAPEGWSRSLKLAYIKTCERVAEACYDGGDIPSAFYDRFTSEAAAARRRLSR